MTSAIVLSGGGAKGAFELGVLKYLYEQRQARPDILVGTSTGSLNAVKLAEGPGSLPGLERVWRAIQVPADIFVPNPQIKAGEEQIKQLLEGRAEEIVGIAALTGIAGAVTSAGLTLALGPVAGVLGGAAVGAIGGALEADALGGIEAELLTALRDAFGDVASLNVFTPLRQLVTANLDPAKVAASGIELRMGIVELISGAPFLVDQHARLVPGPGSAATVAHLQQVASHLNVPATIGTTRGLPTIGTLLSRLKAALASALTFDLIDGVLASCAIPVIFDPVRSNGLLLVDGGVRDILPLQAATDLGATEIVAVQASSGRMDRGLPADGPGSEFLLARILERTVDVLANEVARNDSAGAVPAHVDVTLIRPEIDLQGTLDFGPGIIALNIFYGFEIAKAQFEGTTAPGLDVLTPPLRLARLIDLQARLAGSVLGRGAVGRLLGQQISATRAALLASGAPAVPGLTVPVVTPAKVTRSTANRAG